MRTLCLQRGRAWQRLRTAVADLGEARPGDLVKRNFNPLAPNRSWSRTSPTTQAGPGKGYVTFVMDTYSRRMLGWRTVATVPGWSTTTTPGHKQ